MPVVLVTLHAYRSWSEGNARGFIQHGRGLRESDEPLAKWRKDHAEQSPNRFDRALHETLLALAADVCEAERVVLHTASVTPTHVHLMMSFHEPCCICEWKQRPKAADVNPSATHKRYHTKRCPAWAKAHGVAVRYKRVAGGQLSNQTGQPGRKWFSRGVDISPVHDREHYRHHLATYLPRHEREGGTVKVFGGGGTRGEGAPDAPRGPDAPTG